jgi:hypothetical protein
MAYSKQTWVNDDPSKPINATRLTHIEDGIFTAAATADSAAGGVTTLNALVESGRLSETAISETIDAAVGVRGAGFTRADVAAADTAALADGLPVVLIAGTYDIASNLTITSPVMFHPGARIRPASGVEVILAGGFVSEPPFQVFDHSLGGIVAPRQVAQYQPGWWGPVNSADDSSAWQAAVAAAAVGGVKALKVPGGTSRVWQVDLSGIAVDATGRDCVVMPVAGSVAGTPSSGTGYVVKLGTTGTITGGRWESDGIDGITLIYYTGHRGYVKDAYIFPIGTDTIGIFCEPPEAGSITPRIINTIIQGDSADPNGIGVLAKSADGSMTDVVVAYLTTGVRIERASWVLQNYHVWDCTLYGLDLYYAVYTRLIASYIENCGSWGVYMDRASRTTIASTRFWHNGKTVAGTGGLKLRSEGSTYCDDCHIYDCYFDDNVGTGISIERARRNTVDVTFSSTSVEAGGSPLGTDGVNIASNAFGNHVKISGTDDSSLGGLVNDPLLGTLYTNAAGSQNTVEYFRKVARSSASTTLGPTTTRPDLAAIPVGPGHKLRVEATVVVNGAAANDLAVQLRTSVAPLAGGWYAVDSQPTVASTAGAEVYRPPLALTLSNASGSNVANVGLVGSSQVLKLTGYVEMDTTAGQIMLNAGVVTNDGATATVQYAELVVERVG